MLRALTTLVVCQFIGEVVARSLSLPLPGPVIGLVVLLVVLAIRGGPGPVLRDTSTGLLQVLSLLFVPAGVGIVTQLDALQRDWLPITVAILVSTALGLATTGLVMHWLTRRDPA